MSKVAEELETGHVTVDPRILQRRVDVTRQRTRRRVAVVAVVAGVVAVAVGGWAVLHSPLFAARHVTVVGAIRTGVDPVVAASGLSGEPPLIDVDPGSVAARVEALPWVGRAIVTRHWPDTVTVTVTERVPAAVVVRPGHGDVLVDASGRVLDDVTDAPVGTMVLDVPVTPGRPGTVLGAAARPGLAVVARLPASLRSQVSRVGVALDGVVSLTLTDNVGVVLGRAVELPAKFEALVSVLTDVVPRAPDVIDVTVPGAPAVGPPG
ncbi:MAG TPA: FtsQ-type POTRA domain-containing protein [Acidimicrobiales bacterium]|nr:FtsQ-type POTRA domain-containing protein [Acidimicrobiales bacterium]